MNKKRVVPIRALAATIFGSVMLFALIFVAWSMVSAQTSSIPATCTLSISPSQVTSGNAATLSWTTMNADALAIDNGVATVTPASSGSVSFTPTSTATYTGTVHGLYGSGTCSATVTVTGATTTEGDISTTTPQSSTTTPPTVTPITPPPMIVDPVVTSDESPSLLPSPGTTPAPMVVAIEEGGTALVRGEVLTAQGNMLTLATWDGVWLVRTGDGTSVFSTATNEMGDLSAIPVGNFVGVEGVLTENELRAINATIVRDWTTTPYVATTPVDAASSSNGAASTGTVRENIESNLPEGVRGEVGSLGFLNGTTVVGAATNVNSFEGTFTLTDAENKTYTVVMSQETVVTGSDGAELTITDVQSDDEVSVEGTIQDETVIIADMVEIQ